MKTIQSLLAVAGFVGAASAWGSGWSNETTVWTTVTTDVYTTYCPESTTFTQGTKTYTATASETLTITDCPCTYSHTIPWGKPTTTPVAPPPPPPHNATWVPPVWVTTTETVSSYTTYCPAPTTVVQGNKLASVLLPLLALSLSSCNHLSFTPFPTTYEPNDLTDGRL
ncbi:hypothetical protein F5882DRAFT_80095 [Hyaloscypha sp. PMI_1271]|nr:hypothetical protein F5882DRAFT_80095 [Hyaloscypha sp. PMI_1271]